MKKTLIYFIAIFSISGADWAGELVNSKTNERLILTPDYHLHQLHIDSTDENISSRTVKLSSLSKKESQIKLYGISGAFCDAFGGLDSECLFFLVLPPFLPILAAVDTVILPVKLPMKLIQNATFKRDYIILQKAIAADELIETNSARFNRIVNLLKKAKQL